jgi:hypothetical protein
MRRAAIPHFLHAAGARKLGLSDAPPLALCGVSGVSGEVVGNAGQYALENSIESIHPVEVCVAQICTS